MTPDSRSGITPGRIPTSHQLSRDQFAAELKYIEDRCEGLGIPRPVSFAYPGYEANAMAVDLLTERGYRFARAGGNRVYDLSADNPLLIPSFSTTGSNRDRVLEMLKQADGSHVVVLTVHGVPDYAHPAASTPPELLAEYLQFLRVNQYSVIAMRDLAKYRR